MWLGECLPWGLGCSRSLVCFRASLSPFSSLSLSSLLLPSLSFWKHLDILISHPPIHQSWAGGAPLGRVGGLSRLSPGSLPRQAKQDSPEVPSPSLSREAQRDPGGFQHPECCLLGMSSQSLLPQGVEVTLSSGFTQALLSQSTRALKPGAVPSCKGSSTSPTKC